MDFLKWTSQETTYFNSTESFEIEHGSILPELTIAYRTWGELNADRDNAVIACHSLTSSADADEWWSGIIGPGRALDTENDFVICMNVIGSCYGSTGPTSINKDTGKLWGSSFPQITIRDIVHAQKKLIDFLGVQSIKVVIGGSLGGMQVLEWALLYNDFVESIIPIAISAKHSAWCIGLSEAQRQAIYADANWQNGEYYSPYSPPNSGLAVARMIAMCSYRTGKSYEQKFSRGRQQNSEDLFTIESYLRYQGEKLYNRFDANSYVILTKAMDTHDLGVGREGYANALQNINQPALVVSVDSDILYRPEEQQELFKHLPNGQLSCIKSDDGHDAFLIEQETLNKNIIEFRQSLQYKDKKIVQHAWAI